MFICDGSLETVTLNEPDFGKEATKELDERERERRRRKKIMRKRDSFEEMAASIGVFLVLMRIVEQGIFRVYHQDGRLIEIEGLMKDRAIDGILEEIARSEVGCAQIEVCLSFFQRTLPADWRTRREGKRKRKGKKGIRDKERRVAEQKAEEGNEESALCLIHHDLALSSLIMQ
ncbi:uncharacterized protein MONOS_18367 [Monocercomonoides exilis]|uniref:uncharacterized protein n=1 Tax=Monocercomonoides exilis TaxID=2049356 RepID=UPI0035595494|nr:hypothetical protein MONOS_18367 [Monocercomonoides exilis]